LEKKGNIYGNVFEYYPQREAFKAAILAGHLGPDDQRLLLNCFGAEYLDTTARLLQLEWLRTDPVRSNLHTTYGVEAVSWRHPVNNVAPPRLAGFGLPSSAAISMTTRTSAWPRLRLGAVEKR